MNFFIISFLFSILFNKIITIDYEKIQLSYGSKYYQIQLKINEYSSQDYYIFSNFLPVHLFPSSNCSICSNQIINGKLNKRYTFIQNNVSVPYYSSDYIGDLYSSNITLGSEKSSMEFVAFDKVTFTEKYLERGRFSLSFLNYNFNTEKKIFAILFNTESAELDLGGYNKDIIKDNNKLKTFSVTKTNYTEKYKNVWYINFDSMSINKKVLEIHNFKLTFDISSNTFHIPKDFFFKNMEYIFHQDSKCQIQPEGYFLCVCDRDYQEKFGSFTFINDNNQTVSVNCKDYLSVDDSSSNYCYALIEINYDNDLFIVGKNVMNNYYSIFDVDKNQFRIYLTNDGTYYFNQNDIIIFLFSLCLAGILFLCCFFIYKKYFSRNQEDENLNEDFIEENNEEIGEGEGEGNINNEINDENENQGENNNSEDETIDNKRINNNDDNEKVNNDLLNNNTSDIIILNDNNKYINDHSDNPDDKDNDDENIFDYENNIISDNNSNNINDS